MSVRNGRMKKTRTSPFPVESERNDPGNASFFRPGRERVVNLNYYRDVCEITERLPTGMHNEFRAQWNEENGLWNRICKTKQKIAVPNYDQPRLALSFDNEY